jgi:peptidyl-prolyl cis-trans isomerase SurA
MDTSALFKEEVETYKRIEIQNLLEDRTLLSVLAEDSYQKYQSEINASHIFLPLSWYASPEDTLKVYNELMELRSFKVILLSIVLITILFYVWLSLDVINS